LPTNLEIAPTVNRDEWRALNGVICRAGSPDPRKRFESAHAFARALQTVCPDLDAVAGKRGGSLLGRGTGVLAALLVLLLVVAAAGGYWLWRDNQLFVGRHGADLTDAREKGPDRSGDEVRDLKNDGQVMRPAIPPTVPKDADESVAGDPD